MTARNQLRWLVDELDDEQAERALMVLEASADWILTGELSVVQQRTPPASRDRHRSDVRVAAGELASAGRHSGR